MKASASPLIKAVCLFAYLILVATFFNCLLYFYILKYIPFLTKFVKDCECNLICFPMQQGFRKDFLILNHEQTNILNRWLLDSSLHWLDLLFFYALSIQWNVYTLKTAKKTCCMGIPTRDKKCSTMDDILFYPLS